MARSPKPYRIRYEVSEEASVQLAVHVIRGPRVSILVDEERHPPGDFEAFFEPNGDARAVYYYVLRIGNGVTTKLL